MIMKWTLIWLNWSAATINATLQLLDIIYIDEGVSHCYTSKILK